MVNTRRVTVPIFFWAFICAFLKLGLLRYFYFHGMTIRELATDAFAALAIVGIFELVFPGRSKRYAYWILGFVMSFMLFASTLYFDHFGYVPTYTALTALHQVAQIGDSVKSTIRPIYYVYFLDVVIMFVIWLLRIRKKPNRTATTRAWKIGIAVVTVMSLFLSGRTILVHQSIDNELVKAETMGYLNYQVAAGLKAREENKAVADGSLQETVKKIQDLQSTFAYQDQAASTGKPVQPVYFGQAKGKNLIVIQMEAFQNFPINLKINNQEVTPVLNNLAKEGLYFPNVYQQIGQGNTSDAEFMSNTSIYPTGTIAMSTGYGDRELPSLPRLLQKNNYVANTFHVNDVKFWDRIRLYPALNFDHYYDKPFYTNDHFNEFGASDKELYRVGMEKLSELDAKNQPFYAQFVTVSSHFPFAVPDQAKTLNLPESMQGKQIGEYLHAVHYTDYAIGTLIDQLKAKGMWDNTVMVLYGDHFGLQPQDNDPTELSNELGIKYNEHISRFNIPLLIHVPGLKEGKVVDRVGGQLDIMPTVANLMGISLKDEHFTAFGHDLLNIDHNVFGMRYYMPTGTFFTDDILFIPGKGFEDGKAISLKTFEPIADITPFKKDYDYVMNYMKLSDEYVKLLPKRSP
ncbi:sulfatase [Paenibacillus selenitireducens]|uniref:Sulfatase n=1 Tax=Paenibacillus selenitireducens TaxID=1324314 RepID=A0A1T2XD64_9BACL|nr:LTA synthase family protein [Paenibacillus selenitireducens]OPA77768.1 sulfatase [Paenibacillus selenitireducens]